MKAVNAIRALLVTLLALLSASIFAGDTRIQLVGNITTAPIQLTASSATASSTGAAGGAALTIDGSLATRWESVHGIDPSWLTIDLGVAVDLASVTIHWEAANADTYEIRGSNDNSNWTTLATETGGTFGDRTDVVSISGSYRYVQMYGISRSAGNTYGYSIWEMQVFGVAMGTDTDNDGVPDASDQCAGTPANTPVQSNGCEIGFFGGYDAPTSYPGMSLVWSDEFNGTSLDTNNWVHDIGDGCAQGICGWGNNELQYYLSQNTTVANGRLTIEAKQQSIGGYAYTSSRIKSKGLQEFQYGRIDIRAVMPEGQGLWPALWMLGANIDSNPWPSCGEIDIMEMRGNEPNKVLGTAHWDNFGSHAFYTSDCAAPGCTDNSPVLPSGTFADEFHVFSIVWDSTKIEWYLDGATTPFHVINITPSGLSELRGSFFFLMNIAVGGNFLPNPNGTASFPQQMIVDYVRVYQ